MQDGPIREPWFLRGRRSVLQRAVLISAALAACAMIATWTAIVACVVLFFGPAAAFGESRLGMACAMGLASSLLMGLPLQIGFQPESRRVWLLTLGQWLTVSLVFWVCLAAEGPLGPGFGSDWLRYSWMSVCAIGYAFVFNAWLPRQIRRSWCSALASTFLPPTLPWILSSVEQGLPQIHAWLKVPELTQMLVLSCLWGSPNMAILVPWGLPWWQAPPEEATPE